jgi:hypothetical protein
MRTDGLLACPGEHLSLSEHRRKLVLGENARQLYQLDA